MSSDTAKVSTTSWSVVKQHLRKRPRNNRNSQPVATDWSLTAGRIPHLNDPREDQKVYSFVMNVTIDGRYNTIGATPSFAGDAFSLNTFPSYATKTALFDQYRIRKLEIWIVPTVPTPGSMYHSAIDYDNQTAPTSINQVLSYANCHSSSMNSGHYHSWKPHTAVAAYKGAFTGYQNVADQWIDCAYPDVTQFGIKVAFEATPAGTQEVNIMLRAHVEFRNPFA